MAAFAIAIVSSEKKQVQTHVRMNVLTAVCVVPVNCQTDRLISGINLHVQIVQIKTPVSQSLSLRKLLAKRLKVA